LAHRKDRLISQNSHSSNLIPFPLAHAPRALFFLIHLRDAHDVHTTHAAYCKDSDENTHSNPD